MIEFLLTVLFVTPLICLLIAANRQGGSANQHFFRAWQTARRQWGRG